MKIKDSIMLGVVSGMLAGIPGRILNYIEHQKSLNDMTYNNMAATLAVDKDNSKKPEGKLMGSIINNVSLGVLGIATTYLIKLTGRDYAVPKGIGLAYTMGILMGVITPKVSLVAKPRKRLSYPLAVIDHTILGAVCGYLVSKLGDDKLFKN